MVRIFVPVNINGLDFRMKTIGERLKEERERLGMTIPDFAEAAGAKKNTVIDWQKDVSSPPAAKLAALAAAGVDVLYVLTGQRISPAQEVSINPREAALLDNYRHCAEEDKNAIDRVVLIAATPQQEVVNTANLKKNAS